MRVIVTRPAGRTGRLAAGVRALGHDVVLCPLVRIESLGDDPVDLSPYDWAIITSATGAAELRRRATGRATYVAAIGKTTAEAWGDRVDLVPQVATQEGLLAELPRPAGRVLFAGAEGARRLLIDELAADFVPLYRTVELRPELLPEGDLAILASASAARALGALELGVPAISIGPQTTSAALAAGVEVVGEAARHDTDGLLALLATLL